MDSDRSTSQQGTEGVMTYEKLLQTCNDLSGNSVVKQSREVGETVVRETKASVTNSNTAAENEMNVSDEEIDKGL